MRYQPTEIILLLAFLEFVRAVGDVPISVEYDFQSDVHHRHLAFSSDYETMCSDFKSVYGNCACSTNPFTTLGVITTTAFISCTPPNLAVDANFTSNSRYLSSLKYCNDFKDVCIEVNYNETGNATDCTAAYVNASGALTLPQSCTSCSPCRRNGTNGLTIDCDNVFTNATTNGCASSTELLQYDPSLMSMSSAGAAAIMMEAWKWIGIPSLMLAVWI
jgi:hypothetical protein